jgi:hypothetical protein
VNHQFKLNCRVGNVDSIGVAVYGKGQHLTTRPALERIHRNGSFRHRSTPSHQPNVSSIFAAAQPHYWAAQQHRYCWNSPMRKTKIARLTRRKLLQRTTRSAIAMSVGLCIPGGLRVARIFPDPTFRQISTARTLQLCCNSSSTRTSRITIHRKSLPPTRPQQEHPAPPLPRSRKSSRSGQRPRRLVRHLRLRPPAQPSANGFPLWPAATPERTMEPLETESPTWSAVTQPPSIPPEIFP